MTPSPRTLESLSASQLHKLQADVATVIARRHGEEVGQAEKRVRDELRADLGALAAKWGNKLDEVFPAKARPAPVANGQKPQRARTGSKVPAKFRDGAHAWSGRGKRPRWLAERIAAGAKLDDFRIAPGA